MIIAVDGPTASGKGTIAKALAHHFGLPHLDTGLLYRAVGRQCFLDGGNPDDPVDALAACTFPEGLLEDAELRSEASGGLASRVSIHPVVRQALFERQRAFATQSGGAVLDGRDIGTVIAPDADAKLFVKATPAIRARRRHTELAKAGSSVTYDRVLADIRARDERDSSRSTAPLVMAADAAPLDTSTLSIEVAVERAIALVEAQRGK